MFSYALLPLLAQNEPDGLLRGLLQLLLLLAFFGLPALGRSKEKRGQAKPIAPPRRRQAAPSSTEEKTGRDLWKDLMQGLEQVGDKVEERVEKTRRAVEGASTGSTAARQQPPAPAPARPRATVPPPPPAKRRQRTTEVGARLDTGLSSVTSEGELETGRYGEDALENRGSAEEALERGAAPARERLSSLPSGPDGLSTQQLGGSGGFGTGRLQSSGPAEAGLPTVAATRLFGRRIDAADLRRSIVLAEVLGRPVALREPDQRPGSIPS